MTSMERESLPVLLSIRGEQYFDGVDPDATELMTEGTLELTEEGLTLRYHESALTGMEGTVTTFAVNGPRVTLTRSGSGQLPDGLRGGAPAHLTVRDALTESCRWTSRPAACATI